MTGKPRNNRGLTAVETLAGGLRSQDDMGYIEPGPDPWQVCGACRFYLRDPQSEIGTCQVVDGLIAWYGTSDLFISAAAESVAVFEGKEKDDMAKDQANFVQVGDAQPVSDVVTTTNVPEGDPLVVVDKSPDETKDMHLEGDVYSDNPGPFVPLGVTTFAELIEMKRTKKALEKVEGMTDRFPALVGNILADSAITDKTNAIAALATEYTTLVQEQMEEATKERIVTKQMHYKDVEADDTVARDEDFQGGCSVCYFGEADVLKEVTHCPFCGGENE